MIRAAAIAVFVALACAGTASAQDMPAPDTRETLPGYQPSAFELEQDGFEARMKAFGVQVEALEADTSLTDAERARRFAALWSEVQPDVMRMALGAAELGSRTAGTILQTMDIQALTQNALAAVDIEGEIASAMADIDMDAEIQAAMAEARAELAEARADMADDDFEDDHEGDDDQDEGDDD